MYMYTWYMWGVRRSQQVYPLAFLSASWGRQTKSCKSWKKVVIFLTYIRFSVVIIHTSFMFLFVNDVGIIFLINGGCEWYRQSASRIPDTVVCITVLMWVSPGGKYKQRLPDCDSALRRSNTWRTCHPTPIGLFADKWPAQILVCAWAVFDNDVLITGNTCVDWGAINP